MLRPQPWLMCIGRCLLATGIWVLLGAQVFAEPQPGDVKLVLTKAEKSITKGAADVLIVNDTGLVLPVDFGATQVTVPIGKELAIKVERGLDPLTITEYHWGIRGKPGKTTMGWIPAKATTYASRLGVRGAPKKHTVKKPGGR